MLKSIWKAVIAWFVEAAWPEIQRLLLKALRELAEWLYEKLRTRLRKEGREQEEDFSRKARESEAKAQQAATEVEFEKHKAEARAWRQAFEMLREKNQRMEAELNRIIEEAISKASETVATLKVQDIFDVSADEIKLKLGAVPMLPPPEETK